jgi:hypothetical protein
MKTETQQTTAQHTGIQWTATKAEHLIMQHIAKRAIKLNPEYRFQDALMDLEACHCNGMPLDLGRLLKADDFNFAHDVFGIANHIDRSTGKIMDCFVPRYAKP